MAITSQQIKDLARACGFQLAGIAPALPIEDFERFERWRAAGLAGEMGYLTDRRGDLRQDPRNLLPGAQSIICVGKLYNTPSPRSIDMKNPERGWISRYAWGADYHDVMRHDLERLAERLTQIHKEPFEWKICVDTAPLLERSYARAAGLGWIGKNTCLINQQQGSWFFLGELLVSIPLALDTPPPGRCGTCRRCIDACPTQAIVPTRNGEWTLDSRLCISYLTIEKRGPIPDDISTKTANHLFGCDICQDVCPWNRRAPVTVESLFEPSEFAPYLEQTAELNEEEFRHFFRKSPIWRTKYVGFLRNVAIAMGNSGKSKMRKPLEKLASHPNEVVACAAKRALALLLVATASVLADSTSHLAVRDPLSNPGFVHFYSNEYDQALADFQQQLKAHPDNPVLYNHVAQTVLYRELFRNGSLESELVSGSNPFLGRPKISMSAGDRALLVNSLNSAIELSKNALQKNPEDPNALYALSVAHGLRANHFFLVEKAWMESLREATAARKTDQKLLEVDPGATDARLILALNQYVVGSLPFYLRALGFIGGFHGDKEAGIRQLELVARNGVMNRYDAQVLLAAIYRRERRPDEAIPLLQGLAKTFPRNYLFRFEQVQMYSDLGDKASALRVLDEITALRNSGAPGYAQIVPEKIAYLRGNLLFWYGDLDPALADLKQVTSKADCVDKNTAVMAWLRLGQVYDLQGDHKDAVEAYRETMKAAPNSEAAAEAKGYITNPYHRKRATG